MRDPRRTAATASTLVIGLALVEMVAIFGESAKASVRASEGELRADLVVETKQFSGFSPDVVHRLAALPEIGDAVGFRFGSVRPVVRPPDGDDDERVVAVNGSGLPAAVELQMREGSVGDMGDDGMLVFDDEAAEYGMSVGDRVRLVFPNGEVAVRVAGIYGQDDLFWGSPFVISESLFRRGFPEADLDYHAYTTAAPGVDLRAAQHSGGSRDRRRLSQRRGVDEGAVPRRAGTGDRQIARGHGRAPLPLRDHRRSRHRQHVGVVGIRAHARDRHAAAVGMRDDN